MRRRAVLEGTVEAAEALLDIRLAQTDLLEGGDHGFRRLITDRARGDFEAVADGVILVRLDRQRILVLQRLKATLRHRERVVSEVDLLLFLAPFEEREVDDPAKLETVAIDQVQLVAGAVTRFTGKLVELGRIAGHEEAGIAIAKTELGTDRVGTLLADILGKRAGALKLSPSLRQKM